MSDVNYGIRYRTVGLGFFYIKPPAPILMSNFTMVSSTGTRQKDYFFLFYRTPAQKTPLLLLLYLTFQGFALHHFYINVMSSLSVIFFLCAFCHNRYIQSNLNLSYPGLMFLLTFVIAQELFRVPSERLKRQGHDFRIDLMWYGWIDLNQYRVRQLFIIF